MVLPVSVSELLLFLGIVAATIVGVVFIYRGVSRDHKVGKYHFSWAVGLVLLFLLGFAPGLVGLGLYLTVERKYPPKVMFALVGATLLLVFVLGAAVFTDAADATPAIVGPLIS